MLVFFLVVPTGGGSIAAAFPSLLADFGMLTAGLIAYGAVFAFVGAAFKRPLLIGLIFIFGWEQMAMLIPGYMKRFTVAYYLQALVPHAMPADGVVSMMQSLFRETPGFGMSLFFLGLIWAVFLGWGARKVEKKEYVLEQ
jgi:hypothetical protein